MEYHLTLPTSLEVNGVTVFPHHITHMGWKNDMLKIWLDSGRYLMLKRSEESEAFYALFRNRLFGEEEEEEEEANEITLSEYRNGLIEEFTQLQEAVSHDSSKQFDLMETVLAITDNLDVKLKMERSK